MSQDCRVHRVLYVKSKSLAFGKMKGKDLSKLLIAACIVVDIIGCSSGGPPSTGADFNSNQPAVNDAGEQISAKASYYDQQDGASHKKTASGEQFDPNGLTAAHKSYPFGTVLEVTNPENGKSVDVRINDRGPFTGGRDLDLSKAAAKKIEIEKKGVAVVKAKVVKRVGKRDKIKGSSDARQK